jgi:hypothetical protein
VGRIRSCHANELRSPELVHSVERFDGDRNFGRARIVATRFQSIADDALVAADRRFNFRALVVARRLLPIHSPMFVNRKDMQMTAV